MLQHCLWYPCLPPLPPHYEPTCQYPHSTSGRFTVLTSLNFVDGAITWSVRIFTSQHWRATNRNLRAEVVVSMLAVCEKSARRIHMLIQALCVTPQHYKQFAEISHREDETSFRDRFWSGSWGKSVLNVFSTLYLLVSVSIFSDAPAEQCLTNYNMCNRAYPSTGL